MMPKRRKRKMANEQNLIPFTERSESEVRELNRKGGINSGKARREKRDLQYFARMMLDEIITDKKGNEMPTRYAMLKSVLKKVLKDGDVKAYKAIAETADEMPRNKVDITSDGKALDRVIEIVVNKE